MADFNAAQTTINLTLEVVDKSIASQTLVDEINSGNAPDVVGPVGISASNPFEWLDLTPLITSTGYDLSAFNAVVINSLKSPTGELLGLPLSVYPSFIYYNKDLFDQAGLAYPPHQYGQPYTDAVHGGPWTVVKLAEIARLMTLDSTGKNSTDLAFDTGNIVQYGYVPQWTGSPQASAALFGPGRLVDNGGNAQIPATWRIALKWYYSGMWDSQRFIPNQQALYGALLNGNPFSSGKIAMANSHLWYASYINPTIGPHWDIAATPAYEGTITAKLHVDGFRILKGSKHPAEAFEVLKYLEGQAAPVLMETYALTTPIRTPFLPGRISLQPTYVDLLKLHFPGVDWQVMLDSLAYADIPNHESGMPNFIRSERRINDFGYFYRSVPGLNMDDELNRLQTDLQWIFYERLLWVPVIKK